MHINTIRLQPNRSHLQHAISLAQQRQCSHPYNFIDLHHFLSVPAADESEKTNTFLLSRLLITDQRSTMLLFSSRGRIILIPSKYHFVWPWSSSYFISYLLLLLQPSPACYHLNYHYHYYYLSFRMHLHWTPLPLKAVTVIFGPDVTQLPSISRRLSLPFKYGPANTQHSKEHGIFHHYKLYFWNT